MRPLSYHYSKPQLHLMFNINCSGRSEQYCLTKFVKTISLHPALWVDSGARTLFFRCTDGCITKYAKANICHWEWTRTITTRFRAWYAAIAPPNYYKSYRRQDSNADAVISMLTFIVSTCSLFIPGEVSGLPKAFGTECSFILVF